MEKDISQRANWLKRAVPYRDGSRTAAQKDEDLVARRILNGLGFTSKGIYDLERFLDIRPNASKPLYDRTVSAVKALSGGAISTGSDRSGFGVQCRSVKDVMKFLGDETEGLVEAASAYGDGVIVLCRVENENRAVACVVVQDGSEPPWLLQPISSIVAKSGGYSIWTREVSDLFFDMASLCGWRLPS